MDTGPGYGRASAAGAAMVLILAAAIVLLAVGPRHDRTPALVVIAVVGVMLVLRRAGSRRDGSRDRFQ